MVRLKDDPPKNNEPSDANFNSTMVRLKGSASSKHDEPMQFQFHYGTIKSFGKIKVQPLPF